MMKGGSSYTRLGLGYGERSKYSKKKYAKPELLFTGKIRMDVFGKQEMKKLRREDVIPARYVHEAEKLTSCIYQRPMRVIAH
jgi:hypothetical protein